MPRKNTLNISEAAEVAQVSRFEIRRLMDSGQIPYKQEGPRSFKIKPSDLRKVFPGKAQATRYQIHTALPPEMETRIATICEAAGTTPTAWARRVILEAVEAAGTVEQIRIDAIDRKLAELRAERDRLAQTEINGQIIGIGG